MKKVFNIVLIVVMLTGLIGVLTGSHRRKAICIFVVAKQQGYTQSKAATAICELPPYPSP